MNRKQYIDVAKMIGVLCIVLAHVSPPGIIAQIRNFDVPLMVIISGILAHDAFERSITRKQHLYYYVCNRFTRLVLPTWLFLTIYISGRMVISRGLTAVEIINSFLLGREGIGYVWIIMVYLICSTLTPFLMKVNIYSAKHLALVFGIYVLFEIFCTMKVTTTINALDDILYYIVPYGCITLLGLNYEMLPTKKRMEIAVYALLVFVATAYALYQQNGTFVYTQAWKYPARFYYLSYAVAVSLLLLESLQYAPEKLLSNKMIAFFSKNSLWIYLWHILMIWLLPHWVWYVRFVSVLFGSCFLVLLQNRFVDFLKRQSIPDSLLRILKG